MTTQSECREVGEDFLEHFGKMGMHWGHRKPQDDSIPKTGMSTKKKVAIGVGAVLLVAGIVAVGIVLKKNGISPVSTIRKTIQGARKMSAGKDIATTLVKQQGSNVLKKVGEKVVDKTAEKVSTKLSDKFEAKVMNKSQGNSALKNSLNDALNR